MTDAAIAVVTGAGWWENHPPGLGYAIAGQLAAAGHKVIVQDRELAPAERSAQSLRALGHGVEAQAMDVADAAHCAQQIAALLQAHGRIDILVNAAALTLARWGLRRFHEITPQECDQEIAVTLKGALNATRAVLPHMLERGAGNIIMISSVMAFEPSSRMTIYGLCKAALVNFTASLAAEVGPRGIRVNCVCPGAMKTRVTANMPQAMMDAFVGDTALERMADAAEVANVVSFLVSDAAAYVTGQAIRVDGGKAGLF